MKNPAITVLMAVYNGGKYLDLAVSSVLQQEEGDIEVLIVDDCSTDGSVEQLVKYQDPRLRIHRNSTNLGQTASLNVGLSLARGTFIARMDADDIAYPQWLKVLKSYMQQHPSCAVVSCYAVAIDHGGRILKKLNSPLTHDEILLKALFASPFNHVGCLMRKEVVAGLGGYDESLRIAADYDLWSRILRLHTYEMTNSPVVGVAVRFHASSVTAVNLGGADVLEVCRIMRENIKYFTALELSTVSMRLWWSYKYAPHTLGIEEYNKAVELSNTIFERFTQYKGLLEVNKVRRLIEAQQRIFFVRTCFAMARLGRRSDVYLITQRALKKFGLFSFYGMWWIVSGGGYLVAFIASITDVLFKWCACVGKVGLRK